MFASASLIIPPMIRFKHTTAGTLVPMPTALVVYPSSLAIMITVATNAYITLPQRFYRLHQRRLSVGMIRPS